MDKSKTILIGIDDFKRSGVMMDYADEEVVAISHWEQTDEGVAFLPTVKLDMFVVMICVRGKIRLDINNHSHLLEEGNLIACIPSSTVQKRTLLTPDCNVALVGFSPAFIRRHLPWKKSTWEVISYLYHNPIHPIVEDDLNPFNHYFQLLTEKFKETDHPYRKEIVQHLFATLLLELVAGLNQLLETVPQQEDSDKTFKQRDYIFARFMQELEEDDGTHRSVSYYAKRLCYTSKYLSKVVKEVSGKTALDMINQHSIERIRYQLLHSPKSVKEIADEFEFSNISFFGKFVKNHLGASPTRFRKQALQEAEGTN